MLGPVLHRGCCERAILAPRHIDQQSREILPEMARDVLAEVVAAALLRRQAVLQAEAVGVLRDLHLPAVLTPAGQPIQVGSSVLGLMVWPDLDFTVLCPQLQADQV